MPFKFRRVLLKSGDKVRHGKSTDDALLKPLYAEEDDDADK